MAIRTFLLFRFPLRPLRYDAAPFGQLSREQLEFVEVFIRCEGKFTRMENELSLSYPTIRNRLHEVMRALGYEPGGSEEPIGLTDQERKSILEDLDKGLISAEKAMLLLQEKRRVRLLKKQ